MVQGVLPLGLDTPINHVAWKDLQVELLKVSSRKRVQQEIIYFTQIHQGNTLLSGIEGEVRAGEILAILGGLGSGKTLLTKVLAGRPLNPKVYKLTGLVRINDGNYYRTAAWHRKIGFVQARNELYPALTVEETLLYYAKLRLNVGDSERKERVREVMRMLQLDHIKDNYVGEIESELLSVGNKKRVAIATHVIGRPNVLIVDEPTIGLDPKKAEELVTDIKKLAVSENIAVIMTINPTRAAIFKSLSRILLLCHGKQVFYGRVQEALTFFQSHLQIPYSIHQNPSDYLIDIVAYEPRTADEHYQLDNFRNTLEAAWLVHQRSIKWTAIDDEGAGRPLITSVGFRNGWPNPWWREVWYLTDRDFKDQIRDFPPIVYNVLQRFLVFTLLSFIFFQAGVNLSGIRTRFGVLLFVPVNQASLILTMMVVGISYVRPIIVRERQSLTCRVSSMYTAKFLSEIPVNFFTTLIYSFILYYVTGLRSGFDHFLIFLLTLLLQVYAMVALGFLVSGIAKDRKFRDILNILVFLTIFMFGGYQAHNRQVTWILRWIQYLSPIFYAYIALSRNEFEDNNFGTTVGNVLIQQYGVDQLGIWAAIGALAGLGTVFLICGYIAFRITTNPHRYIF